MSSKPSETTAAIDPQQDWAAYVADFRRAAHEAVDWVAEYLADTRRYPVTPKTKPGELVDALPASGPEKGEPFDAILRDFDQKIIPAVTHWNHPGFLAYFGCTGSSPAIIAEMIAAALNTNGLHWDTSPAVAELEQVALGWLRQWMGLPDDWFGIIYDTASVSSFHAICAAREFVAPESRVEGSTPNLVLYTSEQSHSSIEKGAIAAGIGQKHVRKIPTDSEFRMRPDALAKTIEDDLRAGLRPFCVVATVGTTSSTSIDPLSAIADITDRHKLWLHVDAAYAGSAAILPEFQWMLKGIERAHSYVVNPHKWLLTNIDLSAFYTQAPGNPAPRFLACPRVFDRHGRSSCHQPDGLRRAPWPSFPFAEVMVPAALFRTRAPAADFALAHCLGEETGRGDPPGRALRSRCAGTVLDRLLPSERIGRSQRAHLQRGERLGQVLHLAHGTE